jgi:LPS export ABC transporter protein LptC
MFFNPQSSTNVIEKDVAQMEIEDFTLYEMDKVGVQSVVSGTLGRQFLERYEVENAHYIENKNKLGEHLYADKGRFEKDIVYLNDNVRYFREDGLSFESDYAVYDTKKDLIDVPEAFILTQNENIIYGSSLHYNSLTGQIRAKNIDANYYIEDKK